MNRTVGLFLISAGVVVIVIGALAWSGALSWFGHLPGDIRIEGARSRVFIPITSAIIASVVLTLVLNVVMRLFR